MRTPPMIDDPGHWRQCAEEASRTADQLDDPADKKILLDIAEAYEQLAILAEANRAFKATK